MATTIFKITPRLFISYAREDEDFAHLINKSLAEEGYQTFFDRKSIEIGDIFPERITSALKKCDGCLVIVSEHSVKSEWCKLEAYYANFLNKPLIPIKIGNQNYDSSSPLQNIQKNINYLIIEDTTNLNYIIGIIKRRLVSTERNARNRIIKNISIIVLIILLITCVFTIGINRINNLAYNKDKKGLLDQINTSNKIYKKSEINTIKSKFNNDREIISQLHFQDTDPGLSDIARLNSKIISSSLLGSYNFSQRQSFNGIDWNISKLEKSIIVNSAFVSGSISQVDFNGTQFSDVYFAGFDATKQGIRLSSIKFFDNSFTTVNFDKTVLIDVEFKACRFRGSFINTTNFGAVKFYSVEDTEVVSNGQLTYFSNCIFENSTKPEALGTISFHEKDMQFLNVIFEDCQFKGFISPDWFKNCQFRKCTFQQPTIKKALESRNEIE